MNAKNLLLTKIAEAAQKGDADQVSVLSAELAALKEDGSADSTDAAENTEAEEKSADEAKVEESEEGSAAEDGGEEDGGEEDGEEDGGEEDGEADIEEVEGGEVDDCPCKHKTAEAAVSGTSLPGAKGKSGSLTKKAGKGKKGLGKKFAESGDCATRVAKLMEAVTKLTDENTELKLGKYIADKLSESGLPDTLKAPLSAKLRTLKTFREVDAEVRFQKSMLSAASKLRESGKANNDDEDDASVEGAGGSFREAAFDGADDDFGAMLAHAGVPMKTGK